jgi:hypothetical protein
VSRPDLLLDTSAAVALVLPGHDDHALVMDMVGERTLGLAGHAWFETYSVLTRLPPPARRSPREVARILAHDFPGTVALPDEASLGLTRLLPDRAVAGGAVYDALVGWAAVTHDLPLLTLDMRSLHVYRALEVRVELPA